MDDKAYLESKGWRICFDNIWIDTTGRCPHRCHEIVALDVQRRRDALPWYIRLSKKFFVNEN